MNATRSLLIKQRVFLRQLSATISAHNPHRVGLNSYQKGLHPTTWRQAHNFHGTDNDGIIQKRKGYIDVKTSIGDGGKLSFPDGRDPMQNPLASLTEEEIKTDEKYWKTGGKPGQVHIYERKVDENGEAYGKGGRKRSHARVWIREGTGNITVNGHSWVDYFTRIDQRDKILRPMHLLGQTGKFDVRCSVAGGGQTGQAEAIRFCIARALQNWEPTWRSTLKKEGLLTRDNRIVEMKKYGKKKARKSPQWVKR